MNSAALFPPNLLLALSNGQLYFHLFLELLAGIATYFLCQRLRFSRVISTMAAGAFALNGTFAWLFHSAANPVAFLPMTLLGVEYCRSDRARFKGPAIVAVSLALSLYAGFPETAFIDGLLVVLWVIVRGFSSATRIDRTRYLFRVGLGALVGLLLAAPILVAFLDYLGHAQIGGHGGLFAHYSEPGSSMPPLLIPYVYGPIFAYYAQNPLGPITVFWDSAGGYFTPLLCALAVVGSLGKRDRPIRMALSAWVLLGVGRTFGVAPLLWVLNLVPGVKTTAFFRYAPASWELSVIVLAAFGLQDGIRETARLKLLFASGITLLAVLYAYRAAQPALHSAAGAPESRLSVATTVWGATVLVALVLFTISAKGNEASSRLSRGTTLRSLLPTGLVLLDVFAMFTVPQLAAPTAANLDYGPVKYLQAHLGTNRFFTLGPLAPDYGSYYAVASVNVNDLPTPTLYARYITKHLNSNASPITFTGVDELDFAGPSYSVEFLRHLDAYRNISVKYVLAPSGTSLGPAADGTRLTTVYSDSTVEILYLPGSASFYDGQGCGFSEPSWNAVTVRCNRPTTVLRRELYMPGWSASINGQPLKIRKLDDLFQAVSVPPGQGRLTFQFRPPHLNAALAAFSLGIILLLLPIAMRIQRLIARHNNKIQTPSSAEEFPPRAFLDRSR